MDTVRASRTGPTSSVTLLQSELDYEVVGQLGGVYSGLAVAANGQTVETSAKDYGPDLFLKYCQTVGQRRPQLVSDGFLFFRTEQFLVADGGIDRRRGAIA